MTVMQMYRMDGQVAFVNGAGRGIGAASALALAEAGEAGADVAIRARTLSQLEETAEGIRAFGVKALVLQAVEEDGDDIAALDRAVAELGGLHALVNVVGGAMPAPFMNGNDKKLNDAF